MNEEKTMAKKFVIPMVLAIIAIAYPLSYIFRVSDEIWKMSAISSVPGGVWALCIPLSIFLSVRAYKKIEKSFGENKFTPYHKPIDPKFINTL